MNNEQDSQKQIVQELDQLRRELTPVDKHQDLELEARILKQFPIKGFEDGLEVYQTSLTLQEFLEQLQWQVHKWDLADKGSARNGYQRTPEPQRSKSFGRFTKAGNNSFSSYMLSIRDDQKNYVTFGPKHGRNRTIKIKKECVTWVVDGSHRATGLKMMIQELRSLKEKKKKLDWTKYEIPITLVIGLTKWQEAEYFIVINDSAKKVPTDLAHRLISERKESPDALAKKDIAIYKNVEKIKIAYQVIETMSDKGPFKGRIRPPNKKPKEVPNTTVSETTFERSLLPLMKGSMSGIDLDAKSTKIAQVLGRFWGVILDLCPEPFEPYDENDPKSMKNGGYCLQQQIGVMSMHLLLNELGESLERRLESITKDEFMNLLDIEEITNSKNWKRPTGKWTRRGTNNKSFVEIAEELLETIRTNRKTSKYWRAASR